MVIGIGMDLLDIARLEQALERRPTLMRRLFTDGEQAYAAGRARPAQHLAARFCAKEAVCKALALPVLRPLQIEVAGGGSTDVGIRLHGEAAEALRARAGVVHLSLTHTPTTAGAFAVVEGDAA